MNGAELVHMMSCDNTICSGEEAGQSWLSCRPLRARWVNMITLYGALEYHMSQSTATSGIVDMASMIPLGRSQNSVLVSLF